MNSKLRNLLGPQIKYYREKRGMSQDFLVEQLNKVGLDISQTVLSRIENQGRELYDYEIYAFSEALNVDISDLYKHAVK